MNGRCVYELLSNHLTDVKRRYIMSKEKLFDAFKYYHSRMTGIRDLDFGLNVKPFNELTMDDGVSTEMIKYLCDIKYQCMHLMANKNVLKKLYFLNHIIAQLLIIALMDICILSQILNILNHYLNQIK